ncbi:exosortase family protein XrtF [Tamlana fucoidanivorans]|uniref:Exosortase family protein XrtF n=1 Tax=Allotamlana fucoidanivorans TaxID=2583814 RepID=A0A5C4SIS1_9FLAO|nr:exosortase family protein XrtF [Tamlana fucoidanivorans]TNJ43716.1 exosortase family protein XrtF [Tamlana fucoidanivorans]
MKALLVKYKSVITFILTFLFVYVVLSWSYKMYLQFSDGSKFYPDYVTHLVSLQTEALLNAFGFDAQVIPHPNEPSMKLILNNNYVARIIEGCNAISVIILFVSFIAAFASKLKTTLLFMLAGSILIYSVNVLRIVVLTIGVYCYPEYSDVLHSVVFPAIIYGMMFLLWVIWINRFSRQKKRNE